MAGRSPVRRAATSAGWRTRRSPAAAALSRARIGSWTVAWTSHSSARTGCCAMGEPARVKRLADLPRFAVYGRVRRVVGLVIEAAGVDAALGELCRITRPGDQQSVLAEVGRFD